MQSQEREKSMKPKRITLVLAALLMLSGCTFPSGDDLLAAPKPSTNYQTLQAEPGSADRVRRFLHRTRRRR